MSEYLIRNIKPAVLPELYSGTYILILRANHIPPHLSLLVDGKVFSLEIKGPKLAMPFSAQLKFIRTRQIECLFVKLKTDLVIEGNGIYKRAVEHTLAFARLEPGIATCLSPIKNFCSDVFGVRKDSINFIYDLLAELDKGQNTEGCYHLNMENLILNGTFSLRKYSMFEIHESIYKAENIRL
jgi:hypothetical protein